MRCTLPQITRSSFSVWQSKCRKETGPYQEVEQWTGECGRRYDLSDS